MKPSPTARRAIVAVAALAVMYPLSVSARSFWREYGGFESMPSRVDGDTVREKLPRLEDVSWANGKGTVRAWFAPGTRPAAVVVMHGSGGNRSEVVPEVEILAQEGFSVLAFDWPGHGESTGDVEWDAAEQNALSGALDWLAKRPETAGVPIGAFAFSLGGVPTIQVAYVDPRLRAIALAGAPTSYQGLAHWEYRKHAFLAVQPAILGMRLHGMHLDDRVPDAIVGQLAPRPLLMIAGGRDTTVPESLTRELYDAAREPKSFLEIPDAAHGEYAEKGGAAYAERLRGFFAAALLGDAPDGGSK